MSLKKSDSNKFAAKGENFIMVDYSQVAEVYRLFTVWRTCVWWRSKRSQRRKENNIDSDTATKEVSNSDWGWICCFETAEEEEPEIESISNNQKKEATKNSGRPKILRTGLEGMPSKQQKLSSLFEGNVPTTEAMNAPHNNKYSKLQSLNKNEMNMEQGL